MNYDALLMYLSEVQSGSWEQFKLACHALKENNETTPNSMIARVFSVLGHAEFAWHPDSMWAICKPALIHLPNRNNHTAILCGQRQPMLTESIFNISDIYCKEQQQPEGPTAICVTVSSTDDLIKVAQQCSILFIPDAVEQLTHCIPTISSLIESNNICPYPVVPPLEYFDIQQRSWIEIEQVTIDGVYRYENFYPDYRLIQNNQCRKVPREVGIYAVLDRTYWHYEYETSTLTIPTGLLPPWLYQRVLVLCSGFLATLDKTRTFWMYRDVPPEIALMLAEKLNQPLEEIC
jgi:hypothetical protein